MMGQAGFDTLAFSKRLSAAGMNARQAEALAEALAETAFEGVATKADLRDLENRLTANLTTRTGAMIAGSTALIVATLGVLTSLN